VDTEQFHELFQHEEGHWWFRGQRYLLGSFLKAHFWRSSNLKILDVGCGTGFNLTVLQNYGSVHGIDIADQAQIYCAKRGYNILKGSVEDIPFPSNHFDLVTSLGVFYHKNVEDDSKGLREIYRILKPGGKLFFMDSAMKCLSGNNDIVFQSCRRYSRSELKTKLEDTGFQVNRIAYVNMLFFPIAYVKRQLEFLIRTKPTSEIFSLGSILNQVIFFVYRFDLYLSKYFSFPCGTNIVAQVTK
jgi:ubiquinone/menaquinone biosynthesis C-methylase UbiE